MNIKEYVEENPKNEDKTDDSKILKYINEENAKKMIITELESINAKDEESPKKLRKFSEENVTSKLNTSFDSLITLSDFSKHISSYCTIYLDFDSHSEEYNSYIVYIIIILGIQLARPGFIYS